jgi:AcrR family transcriptional regulator
MPKPTKRSATRHELVLEQLMVAAETLFARQGVGGTSLQELAEAVGLTRTGIYHYVKGKDELLEYLVRGFTLVTAKEVQALAADTSRPALPRLRDAVIAMAVRVAEHPQRFRLLLTSEEAFPPGLAKQHRQARRTTFAALSSLVAQGIADGSANPVDADVTAFALAGVANWVAFWYPHTGDERSPREIAETLADIALGGIADTRGQVAGDAAVPHALSLLREDVTRLEHLLADSSPSVGSAATGQSARRQQR